MKPMIFATRPSALARWQTGYVMQALQAAWSGLDCQEATISTQGDRILDRPLPEIGGKGIFTQELEAELIAGRVHAAVHSLKDLPVENPPSLTIGAIPLRAEPRDALVSAAGCTLENLPEGARVGTSSLRRAAQILARRPDVRIEPLRGNVDTRLRKSLEGQYDAVILAGAGLTRLGLEAHVTEWLPLEVMLPAPGQGALAVQCREDDWEILAYLAALEHLETRLATAAERAFLSGLGGGCSLPIAAFARLEGDEIVMDALAAAPDGKRLVRVHGRGVDPQNLGAALAAEALGQGAWEFLNV